MKMLFISPVLLIAFICIIVILIYLYRTSELLNKRKLSFLILFFAVVFIVSNLLYILQNKEPAQKFRLTIYPFYATDHLSRLIPDIISKQLYRIVKDQALIIPVEWTVQVVNQDSVADQQYLANLSIRLKSTHFLIGAIVQKEKQSWIKYQITPVQGKAYSDSVVLSLKNLPSSASHVTSAILNYLQFPRSNIDLPRFSTSSSASENYVQGVQFYIAKNYPAAMASLLKAIAEDSTFAEAQTLLARAFLAAGVRERAKNRQQVITEFKNAKYFALKAMALDSTNDENFRLLGEYYIYNERWSQAELMLRKAFQMNSNNYAVYLPFSRFHEFRFRKIGFRNDEQLYRRAVYLNPCYEEGYMTLADHYLFNNKRQQGIETLEEFLKIHPRSIAVLMTLGKIYLVKNDFALAVACLQRVMQLAPDNSDAPYNLGILYYNTRDYENAEKYFQTAIAIDNHLNSYLYLAYLHEDKGDHEKAIYYLRQRIHFRTGLDDEFAEEARKHLYKLLHDSTRGAD